MLVFGTQMHIVTFAFVCIELAILFYLILHRLARPDDKATSLNIVLIVLLIVYNVTGGLLPDPNMPGSYLPVDRDLEARLSLSLDSAFSAQSRISRAGS